MAYEKVSGTVEAISRNGKTLQLDDGEWYGAFSAAQIGDVQVGDSVKFDMQANDKGDKTFLNIKGNVKLISEGGRDNEEEDEAPRARSSARGSARAPARSSAGRTTERAAAPERTERAGAPARGARTSSASAGGSDPRQTSIVRQSSVTAALRVLELNDALKADVQELDGQQTAEFIIEIARVFEAYGTSTD